MKKMGVSLVAMVVLLSFGLQSAIADTEVSGNITSDTTWTVEGSPYIVVGTVEVASIATLTIEPGVTVRFNDGLSLNIGGELIAKGSVTDSILFTSNSAAPNPGNWGSIKFVDSSIDAILDSLGNYIGGCVIEYCRIENGGGIHCDYASPFIGHNTVTGNFTSGDGGIYCWESSPTIANNTISGNSAPGGGGICCDKSSPTITNNTISGNSAGLIGGGGIYCFESSPIITGNTITWNSAGRIGGGICCWKSTPAIANNIIAGNSAGYNGGGICCWKSSPTITNNTIGGNSAGYSGGGIGCRESSPTITGDTITWNSAGHIGGIICDKSSPTIANNIMAGNSAGYSGDGICCYGKGSSPTINYNNLLNGIENEIFLYNVSNNIDAMNNWWGTTNTDSIDAKIWDHYDIPTLGKLLYEPFLTSPLGEKENAKVPTEIVRSRDEGNKLSGTHLKARYTRKKFRRLIIHKTRKQVIEILGQPSTIFEIGNMEHWFYNGPIAYDPLTKAAFGVHLGFEAGRVSLIDFTAVLRSIDSY